MIVCKKWQFEEINLQFHIEIKLVKKKSVENQCNNFPVRNCVN